MGQIFQRTYKAADGTQRTCDTWTLRYYRNGRPHQRAHEVHPARVTPSDCSPFGWVIFPEAPRLSELPEADL